MVNAGQTAQVEILRAEAGVARQLAAIITAENALRDRQREFKRLLNKPGLPIDSVTIPIPSDEPDPVHYDLEAQPMIARAMETDGKCSTWNSSSPRTPAPSTSAKNQTLPLVTLDYSYNINGVGPTRAGANDMLSDKNFETHAIGCPLVCPPRQRGRQERPPSGHPLPPPATRRPRIPQAAHPAGSPRRPRSPRGLLAAILTARQSSILEGRLYEAEIRQFEQGLRTSTDVFQAQTTFADAQSPEIAALVAYEISLVDIAYATGTLLGAAKVEWLPVTPDLSN